MLNIFKWFKREDSPAHALHGGPHKWTDVRADQHNSLRRIWECKRCLKSVSMGEDFSPGPQED